MSKLKFRAWNKRLKSMFEVYEINLLYGTIGCFGDSGKSAHTFGMIDVEIIQFTGLLDKNGVEIYEGDILKVPDEYEEYGMMAGEMREIYFRDGCFRFKPKKDGYLYRGCHLEDNKEFEIIGNIYQHPELLGEDREQNK